MMGQRSRHLRAYYVLEGVKDAVLSAEPYGGRRQSTTLSNSVCLNKLRLCNRDP